LAMTQPSKQKVWEFKLSKAALQYLQQQIPNVSLCPNTAQYLADIEAKERAARLARSRSEGATAAEVRDYRFKTTPFDHQVEAFLRSRDLPAFALFMEQGTGKSKVIVDTIAYLHAKGELDTVIIAAPNSVKTNWVFDELPTHMPAFVEYTAAYWESAPNKAEKKELEQLSDPSPLRILVVNIEALSTARAANFALSFIKSGMKTMLVVDESSRIKTYSAARTKTCRKLAKHATYRRILSGTPITKNPLDLYAQLTVLDDSILGFSSFYSYRNRYCIMGGYENKEVIAYQNLDELVENIAPFNYRVLKRDCLDLPDKIYQKLAVKHTPEQKRAYKEMREFMFTKLEGETEISASIALTQIAKLQQINSGFMTDENGVPVPIAGKNPRLDALLELLEQHGGKAIIWSRWRYDIEVITSALKGKYGEGAAAAFYGPVSTTDRTDIRQRFQDSGDELRFFVGHPAAGGIGLTLTEANLVVYYSNDFSLESRLQSEDRAHRIGQVENVTYVDIATPGTVDTKIVSALRSKKDIADRITQDGVSQWI